MNCSHGLPEFSFEAKICYIVINLMIGLCSVFGNILVICAVVKTPSLQFVSNYFICSLAVADLLVGLLVAPLNGLRTFQPQMTLNVATELLCLQTLVATTMNLTAVSIDRFIAIIFPLRYNHYANARTTQIAITSIWISSTLFSVPSLLIAGKQHMIFWLITIAITLFIPLVIIIYCYESIRRISKIHQVQDCRHPATADTIRKQIKNHKASMTFAIIIAVFFISFAPNLISNTYYAIVYSPCRPLPGYILWTNAFMFISSVANPVIYSLRSRDFRLAFKRLICRKSQG